MRNINKIIIVGNLTRDPETKATQNGQSITTFGVATNREWMSNGEKKESAEFHEVVAWGKLGEICQNYLKKSKLVYLEGYLKTRSWEDEATGEKKYRTEIVLQDMVMLEKRGYDDNDSQSVPEEPEVSAPQEENMF